MQTRHITSVFALFWLAIAIALPLPATAAEPATKLKPLPVPSADAQQSARALVREAYAREYNSDEPAMQEKLPDFLRTAAQAADVNPTERYVLLLESCEAAARKGNVRALFTSLEALEAMFAVDPADARATFLSVLARNPPAAHADRVALVGMWDKLAMQHLARLELQPASRAIGAMDGLSRNATPELRAIIAARKRECRDAVALTQAAASALETLRGNAEDPRANQAVGRHACFVAANWQQGLKFLAKSPSSPLQQLAVRDLRAAPGAEEQFELAQEWWKLSATESALAQICMRSRAAHWYALALPGLTGIRRNLAEKNLAESKSLAQDASLAAPGQGATPGSGKVDLLKLVNVQRDGLNSNWSLEGTNLVCSWYTGMVRLQLLYQPPEEYDFTVELTPAHGEREVCAFIYAGGKPIRAFVSNRFPNSRSGFDHLAGKPFHDAKNPATVQTPEGLIASGKTVVLLIQVRRDGLAMSVDGEELVAYETDFSDFDSPPDLRPLMEGAMGLGAWYTRTTFHRAEVAEISGPGRVITEPPPLRGAPREAVRFGDRWVLALPVPVSRSAAEYWCRRNGARLIIIRDAQENAALVELLEGKEAWIGASTARKGEPYKWADGSALSYTNWAPGEPSESDSETAVCLLKHGKWNNDVPHVSKYAICEWP